MPKRKSRTATEAVTVAFPEELPIRRETTEVWWVTLPERELPAVSEVREVRGVFFFGLLAALGPAQEAGQARLPADVGHSGDGALELRGLGGCQRQGHPAKCYT